MELRNRTRYLKQLISFQDTDLIKVVTGIRRCGKSSLLELMEEHGALPSGNGAETGGEEALPLF